MVLKTCEIFLDNNWATYYTGQTVTGRVEVIVDSPKRVRGITITFKGEASTNWSIEESKTNNEGKQENEQIELVGTEEYFKTEYYLLGGQGGEIVIPPGSHVYPFTCVLPPTLPSSFEGEFGFIRYTIRVTLDRPWKFDQETKRAFTVLSPVDLNLNPRLKERTQVSLEKYFCCCWCKSGPLTCVVTLPQTGYVPGQTIPVVAEVDNISNVEITNVEFTLQKVVTYHSQRPRREVKKDIKLITEVKLGAVGPNASNTWNHPINIPSIPPSNLTNCTLIDLDYILNIVVHVAGFHTNLESKIPITIGTIPLVMPTAPIIPANSTVINMTSNSAPGQAINGTQAPPAEMGMGWVGNTAGGVYPTLPAFAESQFRTTTIQEKGDSEHLMYWNNSPQYSPMYPMFNPSQSQPQPQ